MVNPPFSPRSWIRHALKWDLASRPSSPSRSGVRPTESSLELTIDRYDHEGWIDFYIGAAQQFPHKRCSLMDPHQRVGLHYLASDLDQLKRSSRPSPDIPHHLWVTLQKKGSSAALAKGSYKGLDQNQLLAELIS